MSLTELPSVRLGARVVVFALLLGVVVVGGACQSALQADGQACLKSQDCVSGICSQLVCAAASPLTDAEAEAAIESGPAGDAGEAGPTEAAAEAAPAEAGSDSGGD